MKNCILFLCFLVASHSFGQVKTGDKAPDLNITNWIENVPASKSLKGKLLVVDFWATWCAPCLESVPHLNTLVEANKQNSNLVFLSISDEKEKKIRFLLPKVHFSSIVVADSTGKTFRDFGIESIPFCVLIDENRQVKWSGIASRLNAGMIREFVKGEQISVDRIDISEDKKFYDSLSGRYIGLMDDTTIKECFAIAPLTNKSHGMQSSRKGGGVFQEVAIGKPLSETIARLQGVSTTQVLLPDMRSPAFISYCYKSRTKVNFSDLLDNITAQLNWRLTLRDSIREVMYLEVKDTSLLYADLPEQNSNYSRLSTSDDGIISLKNNDLLAITNTLEEKYGCVVEIKDAAKFSRKIDMTIMAASFARFEESMASYGIRVTKEKRPLTMYVYQK